MDPNGAPQSPETGQDTGTPPAPVAQEQHWTASLSDDLTFETTDDSGAVVAKPLREHAKLQEFKSVGDLAKAYANAEKLIGKRQIGITPPDKDAPDEAKAAWDKEFRKVMGVPDAPDAYEIAMPKGMEADPALMGFFKGAAHELGLSPQQAQTFSDRYNDFIKDYWGKAQAAMQGEEERAEKARKEEVVKTLDTLWGKDKERNAEIGMRGFDLAVQMAGVDAEEAKAFMESTKLGDHPVLLRIFHALGKAQAEHATPPGGGPGGGTPTKEQRYSEMFNQKGG